MNAKQLEQLYHSRKIFFHQYIKNIKQNCKWDIYNIVNPTLITNPYASKFPKDFFNDQKTIKNTKILFLKNSFKYYLKNFYYFVSYFIAFILFKIYYRKQRKNNIINIIDIFALIDNINKGGIFEENYLKGLYNILEKYNVEYTMLLRPYLVGKNPFKLIRFFKIINNDNRDFVFEYEFLKFKDFFELCFLILLYPFKLTRLLQKEDYKLDKIFNNSLLEDITYFNFDGFARYVLGKNLANIQSIKKIYSWSEFQVVERSFNYGIRKSTSTIELIAMQFYLNYEIYFNSYVDDLDYEMLASPHKVFVNGKYYLKNRKKVKYNIGVSLRYKNIFSFSGVKEEKNILLLGSYLEDDTKYMISSVKNFDNVIFKNHPTVNIKNLGTLPKNMTIATKNIYRLFETTKIAIGTASGTSVEAVACGISVIIMASQDNLTANPLVEYGKGKIWDMAFSKDEITFLYNKLLDYRKNNKEEIKKISNWYKDNFFVEPTEENIKIIFGIN
ncbi:hypothetical protein CIG2463D_0051 [Campylobacter iguaniorum]|uniref:hypothetical protein n=1 Tax=Campylobacter iguaniorum TaxID=1244531 RepID=UPI000739FF77|nr:hypothetical protein [Campylobacter iguaniorum]ALV23666.1 hypothetical protein CIG2463D_0051 [Campylobacter iguaniorum]